VSPEVWIPIAVGAAIVIAVLAAAALLWWRGQKEDARALVGFVPDCIVLAGRLLRDRRVGRGRKLLLLLLVAYLATPIDLLPGSPIDDALIAALVLRFVLRGQAALIRELWPGPRPSRDLLVRLSGQ
jgi:uncharacterized membrane protein YkvA (DUF1232 family)